MGPALGLGLAFVGVAVVLGLIAAAVILTRRRRGVMN